MENKGFSLIELMLVIIIIALFATFTYPSYRGSITRSRRIDGQTALLELANRMERYYVKQHTYRGATLGAGSETDVQSSNHSPQNWYILTIARQTDSDFSLEATPIRAQAKEDIYCQKLSFNSLGVKNASASQCW